MNKEEYIKNLPGELAKEDINKIEDFFLSELSAGARENLQETLIIMYIFMKNLDG